MLGKTVMIPNRGYGRVELTEKETDDALAELLQFNIKELNRIIVETKNSNIMAINQTEAIKLLFEKQGMACYTFLQSKLDEKIDKLKSTDSN